MTDKNIGTVDGKCLCGAVQISIHDTKPGIDACHCTMCRKWGGGAFFGITGGSHKISGADHVTAFKSSDWAERASCSQCKTNLWYHFLPTDDVIFQAGMFNLPKGAVLEQQIFVDEKPSYYDFAQQTPMKTGAEVIAEATAAGMSFDD